MLSLCPSSTIVIFHEQVKLIPSEQHQKIIISLKTNEFFVLEEVRGKTKSEWIYYSCYTSYNTTHSHRNYVINIARQQPHMFQ